MGVDLPERVTLPADGGRDELPSFLALSLASFLDCVIRLILIFFIPLVMLSRPSSGLSVVWREGEDSILVLGAPIFLVARALLTAGSLRAAAGARVFLTGSVPVL